MKKTKSKTKKTAPPKRAVQTKKSSSAKSAPVKKIAPVTQAAPKQKMVTKYFYTTVSLFILGIILGYFLGRSATIVETEQVLPNLISNVKSTSVSQTMQSTQEEGKISIDDDAILGDRKAKVTIVEFSDYACPTCKKAFDTVFEPLRTNYIENGKVRYVLRDFPLEQHAMAPVAAQAAECAGEQDKYFDMHDKLFIGQKDWVGKTRADDAIVIFRKYAAEIKLNTSDFDECMKTNMMESEVAHDISDGELYGVTATPTYFINNTLYKGIQNYDAIKAVLDADLE